MVCALPHFSDTSAIAVSRRSCRSDTRKLIMATRINKTNVSVPTIQRRSNFELCTENTNPSIDVMIFPPPRGFYFTSQSTLLQAHSYDLRAYGWVLRERF